VLATGRARPLAALWRLGYRALARSVTAHVSRGEPGAAAYVRGAGPGADFVPGLSDIDVAVVLAAGGADARGRVKARWNRLRERLPPVALVLDPPRIYAQDELRRLESSSAFTHGLEAREPRLSPGGYFGSGAHPAVVRTLDRPGLYETTGAWRRVSGPERRPPPVARDPQMRRIAAWLELLYWWRWAFPACLLPRSPRTADLCVKFVAEPARIWLWLGHGERVESRAQALERALRRLPEEEDALRGALALQRDLTRAPHAPLARSLPALLRLSGRIARLIAAEVGEAGATTVRLAGTEDELILARGGRRPRPAAFAGRPPRLQPLADWRALVCPRQPDETFAALAGDPGDPGALAAAARALPAGPYPLLRGEGLAVMPAEEMWRSRLRSLASPATAPVTFALLEGEAAAAFPEVRGWCARDVALRAVAEHRAWLAAPEAWGVTGPTTSEHVALAMLLTAARAALFYESVRAGDAELALTLAETARRLAERSQAGSVAGEALEEYRAHAAGGRRAAADTVSALRRLVLELPAYADAGRAALSLP
jgi:hypothetical protein